MVIDGRNTLIVDPPGLFRELRPDWFAGGAAGDGPPAAAGGGVPATGQDTAGQLVLVADDSAFFRDKISDLLGGAGYRVICAEDGGKAWESYQANPGIAAAVVDLEMPVMDGTALARLLRQADPAVPIIALTSLASDDDRRRALEAGVTEFMIKLDEQELVSGLARLVQGAKL
jgi:two-component system chemotaxis sensor kinase CheA